MTSTINRADCGHVIERVAGSIGTGYARMLDDSTLCYPCADDAQRLEVAGADTFTGYVSSDGRRITTWTGGELAFVTYVGVGRPQYTATGGRWSARYVRATTPDGREWYGRGNADWDAIRLRAARLDSSKRTFTATLEGARRIGCSVNGNPTWELDTDAGTFRTQSDASLGYSIGNYLNRRLEGCLLDQRVTFTASPAGRVWDMRAAS